MEASEESSSSRLLEVPTPANAGAYRSPVKSRSLGSLYASMVRASSPSSSPFAVKDTEIQRTPSPSRGARELRRQLLAEDQRQQGRRQLSPCVQDSSPLTDAPEVVRARQRALRAEKACQRSARAHQDTPKDAKEEPRSLKKKVVGKQASAAYPAKSLSASLELKAVRHRVRGKQFSAAFPMMGGGPSKELITEVKSSGKRRREVEKDFAEGGEAITSTPSGGAVQNMGKRRK
mmetsp:Transcript_96153/g.170658  ORF Transcript_96153/g.170658 Transcript_96153/m.170658 type:complete len:233 (-) Transcript_96153:298-996(-)